MLYYRPPLATTVSDKYAVRSHVAERVGAPPEYDRHWGDEIQLPPPQW